MIVISAPDFLSTTEWDKMSDWLLTNFGKPSRRWNYYADTHTMTIYFDSEPDAMMYIMCWGGKIL